MSNELAVMPKIAQPSLYEYEQDLLALLDTEAMVSPEQQAEFQADLAEQLQKTVAKRDRVGAFIKHLEMQAKFAGEEIKRLQERKRLFENVEERLRGYVLNLIEQLGPDSKGKLRKLEGERFTLQARACPASLEITDAEAVPAKYKRAVLSMDAETWLGILDILKTYADEHGEPDLAIPYTANYHIDFSTVKSVLSGPPVPCETCGGIGMFGLEGQSGEYLEQCPVCHGACSLAPTVPGAELILGKLSLQVK